MSYTLDLDNLEGHVLLGLDVLSDKLKHVKRIREYLTITWDRQKKYVDAYKMNHQHAIGDPIFLRVNL